MLISVTMLVARQKLLKLWQSETKYWVIFRSNDLQSHEKVAIGNLNVAAGGAETLAKRQQNNCKIK